jgi:hypothetical protein
MSIDKDETVLSRVGLPMRERGCKRRMLLLNQGVVYFRTSRTDGKFYADRARE